MSRRWNVTRLTEVSNSMDLSPSSEAARFIGVTEVPKSSCSPKIRCLKHKRNGLVRVRSIQPTPSYLITLKSLLILSPSYVNHRRWVVSFVMPFSNYPICILIYSTCLAHNILHHLTILMTRVPEPPLPKPWMWVKLAHTWASSLSQSSAWPLLGNGTHTTKSLF
jgi:hypothetical protein